MNLPRFSALCALASGSLLSGCSMDSDTPRAPVERIVYVQAPAPSSHSSSVVINISAGSAGSFVQTSDADVDPSEQPQEAYEEEEEEEETTTVEQVERSEPCPAPARARDKAKAPAPIKAALSARRASAENSAPAPASAAGSGEAAMRIVSEEDFERRVLSSPIPVLVVFEASWCPFCKRYAPLIEAASQSASGFAVARVDVDKNPGLARKWSKGGVPATRAFIKGEISPGIRATGLISAQQLAALTRSLRSKAPVAGAPLSVKSAPSDLSAAPAGQAETEPSPRAGPSL